LTFMVKPMEKAIQRELDNVTVRISDTVIQKAENGFGVVFRLKGLQLFNSEGAPIAQTPSAAIGISTWGLLAGKIAPSSVNFIGPELILEESSDGNIGLAFSQKGSKNYNKNPDNSSTVSPETSSSLSNRLGNTFAAAQAQQTDIVQTLYNLIKNARDGKGSTSYLSQFGVRNAAFLLRTPKGETQFRVPNIQINFQHKSNTSIISGRAKVTPNTGKWDLSFKTELNPNSQQISLIVNANNLAPSAFENIFPNMKALQAFRMPLNGSIRFDLSRSGELLSARSNLKLSKGVLHFSEDSKRDLSIDRGNLRFKYDKENAHIQVLKSSLHWGGSHAVFSGGIQHGTDDNGINYWQFLFQTEEAAIETQEFGIGKRKIDNWSARGFIVPSQKRINLAQLLIQSGKSYLDFSGDIIDAPGSPRILLNGKVSPMEMSLFKQLWPRLAAPGARDWIGKRVTKGYITGGNIKVSIAGGMLKKLSERTADIDDNAFNFELGIRDLETYYVTDLPPIQASTAVARFSGRKFAITVPNGTIGLPSGQNINITNGVFDIPDLRTEVQTGNISFDTGGDVQPLLEFLDLPSLGYLKEADFDKKSISGSIKGRMALSLPLVKNVKFKDMKMDGQIILKQAAFSKIAKDLSAENGTITFGISEKAIDAKGRLYLNGVPVNISWHRIFRGAADKQPGVRISANLNSEKLARLNIPIDHFIKGNVPTTVVLRPGDNGQQVMQLQADLNNAELILGRLGWSKPPGKRAALEMQVNRLANGRTDIRNFKILGDDITINGELSLGKDGKLDYFSFPDFSVNVVTQLVLKGRRDPRRGWKINVDGPTYDGRQFFKSIFSTGKVSKEQDGSSDKSDVEVSVAINTVLGFSNTKMQKVRVFLQQREGRLSVFEASGNLGKGRLLAKLKYADNEARILEAETNDTGYAFKMIGFYPNIESGETAIRVNLDAGESKQSGTLWTRNFSILGGVVEKELFSGSAEDGSGIVGQERGFRRRIRQLRERIPFDQMKVKFSTGKGVFELDESFIKGPSIGVFLDGNIDFENRKINLAGTYTPIYGINSLFGPLPFIGEKGVISITFGISGNLDQPQVSVNPASIVGFGIFNELFKHDTGRKREDPFKDSEIFPNTN
ncbi:MAG: DUF3971 domain-containing protein, partial [Methyloligellaceae bacterium]